MTNPGAGALERGRITLSRGAWKEAKQHLEQAASAEGSPEAYELLSWAAWWDCDGDTVFSARERSHRLYLDRGDVLGAARMATWLSVDTIDFRGEVAVAQGWRQRARRLLTGVPPAPEHAWLALLEGDQELLVEEDVARALASARKARTLASDLDVPDVRLLGLALEGIATVSLGKVVEGMRLLDEAAATALAGEFRERFALSWTFCYLIYACERARDYDRAAEWCSRLREYAERAGVLFGQGVCRAHYGGFLVWRGDWPEAESELTIASELLSRARPAATAEAHVRLGELRRRQGRLKEALALFDEASPHPLALLGQAEVAIQEGRLGDAEEDLERLRRHIPEENKLQLIGCLELLVRVQALAGDPEKAAATWGSVAEIAAVVPGVAIRAAASFSAGFIAAASDHLDDARRRFEDAIDLYIESGAPYETAQARLELARVLLKMGRTQRARAIAAQAKGAFDRLGASTEADQSAALCDWEDGDVDKTRFALTARQIEILRLIAED